LRDRILSLREAAGSKPRSGIRMVLNGGLVVCVRPMAYGRDWVSGDLIDESPRRLQCIVPIAAIAGLELERAQVVQSLASSDGDDTGLASRIGLGIMLRDLCRRRRAIDVRLLDGELHGTIDRVGRDHFDLAVHEPGMHRREREVGGYRVVPFAQLLLLRVG
ncbi:MAG: hypothetical protein JWO10_283, partial [Microbacteriaceae bacterium]|nr:hypothetical protein [Microbacteriaceae bacterium]